MNRRTILKSLATLPFFGFLKTATAKETDEFFTGKVNLPDVTNYFKNGKLHREDGPAVIHNGTKEWYQNGEKHRVDGPAIITNGEKWWYQNNLLHRTDGPAIEYDDGTKVWYQNGVKHRIYGPAIVSPRGNGNAWFENGIFIK